MRITEMNRLILLDIQTYNSTASHLFPSGQCMIFLIINLGKLKGTVLNQFTIQTAVRRMVNIFKK